LSDWGQRDFLGWMKLKNLQSYGWAMAAVVVTFALAVLVCPFTIVVGIWPLVVLLDPDVKASFGTPAEHA